MYLGPEMYSEVRDLEVARRVFAGAVHRVEVETHSYCNRRCTYCPNHVGDRLGPNQRMASETWGKLMSGLEGVKYSKYLVFNYYNEPLSDRSILDRISEARSRLLGARLMLYTNGDYLDPSLIDNLAVAGLDYMHISIHLKRGDRYDDLYVLNRLNEISVRMGIPTKITGMKAGEYVLGCAPHNKIEIEVRGINFERHGTDRGGLISDISNVKLRSAACFFPFAHFVVSYEGDVAPCCHIRSDRPEHRGFLYGNLAEFETIYQAFTSAAAAAWRRELASDLVKRAPCDTCSAGHLEPRAQAQLLESRARNVGHGCTPGG